MKLAYAKEGSPCLRKKRYGSLSSCECFATREGKEKCGSSNVPSPSSLPWEYSRLVLCHPKSLDTLKAMLPWKQWHTGRVNHNREGKLATLRLLPGPRVNGERRCKQPKELESFRSSLPATDGTRRCLVSQLECPFWEGVGKWLPLILDEGQVLSAKCLC